MSAQTPLALRHRQSPVAVIANTATILNEVSNTAEVEQEAILSNIGCIVCTNTFGAQTQAYPVAVIANTATILNEVSNTAEVEQEAILSNIGCVTCANTFGAQTQAAPVVTGTSTLLLFSMKFPTVLK